MANQTILIRIRNLVSGANALRGQASGINAVANALQNASKASQNFSAGINSSGNAAGTAVNNYKGLVGQVANLNKGINIFGATIRQVGQGLQNLGTTLTAFVSIPAGFALRGIINVSLDLDDALIEVRKNAGLARNEIDALKRGLVSMSQTTPTIVTDLANISATAGRLGLSDVNNILAFTEVIDKLSIATGLSVEDAAPQVGRIANIFLEGSRSGEEYRKFIISLGSAINELGQNIAGSEAEIIASLLRAAPAAAAIGVPVDDLLGIVATLVETTASAERSGTQLNRALTELASNAEDVAKAFGLTVDQTRDYIDTDPVGFFLGVSEAIGNMESASLRAAAAEQLFGQVGAKTINILGELAGDQGKLAENIALANKAFEEGTSLQLEFERAMDSVRNQIGIFRNGIVNLGLILGDVLLPSITKVLTFAIPGVKVLSEGFAVLSDRTKLFVAAALLLAAVVGPAFFAIGSVMFSLGIIITGLTTAMVGLFGLVGLPVRLALGLLSLITPMRLLVVAIGLLAGSFASFRGSLSDMSSDVTSLISQMFQWGFDLISAFSDGILSASNFLVKSVQRVLEVIAGFFESNSPPKKGPLRRIDRWGASVAQTFVDSFGRASMRPVIRFAGLISGSLESALRGLDVGSFGIFEKINSLATSAARALLSNQGADKGGIADAVNRATEFAALLARSVGNGGNIAQGVFDGLRAAVGPFADDLARLVGLQKNYNDAQRELQRIRDEQESLDSNLQKEIEAIAARTDLSDIERAALIRAAKFRRNEREKELEEKEKAAEESVKIAREEADGQETVLRALINALSEKNKALKDQEESDIIGVGNLDVPGISGSIASAREELDRVFDGLNDDISTFMGRISDAEVLVRAFVKGLTGEGLSLDGVDPELGPKALEAFLLGRDIRAKIQGIISDLEGFIDSVERVQRIFESPGEGGILVALFGEDNAEKIKRVAIAMAGFAAALLALKSAPFIIGGIKAIGLVVGALLSPIGLAAAAVVGLIVALVSALSFMEPRFFKDAKNGFDLIKQAVLSVVDVFARAFISGLEASGVSMDEFKDAVIAVWGVIKIIIGAALSVFGVFMEILVAVGAVIGVVLGLLLGFIFGFLVGIVGRFFSEVGKVIAGVPEFLSMMRRGLDRAWVWIDALWQTAIALFRWFYDEVTGSLQELAGKFSEIFSEINTSVRGIITAILSGIIALIQLRRGDIIGALESVWNGIVTSLEQIDVLAPLADVFISIRDTIAGWKDSFVEWGLSIVTSFWEGWSSFDAKEAVAGWIRGWIPNLESRSPPREGPLKSIADWGSSVASTFVGAFSSANIQSIESFASVIGDQLSSRMLSAVRGVSYRIEKVAEEVSGIISRGFSASSDDADDYMRSILVASFAWVVKNRDALRGFGALLAKEITRGFAEAIEASSDVFDVISDTFVRWQGSFFSGSDSVTSTAKEIGRGIASAMSVGITQNANLLSDAIVNLVTALQDVNNSSSDIQDVVRGIGEDLGNSIATSIGVGISNADSVVRVVLGISSVLSAVKSEIGNLSSSLGALVRSEAFGIGSTIAQYISNGIQGSTQSVASAVTNTFLSGGVSGAQSAGGIEINVYGEVVVDNDERMNRLADQIAYKLGRNASQRARFGGV